MFRSAILSISLLEVNRMNSLRLSVIQSDDVERIHERSLKVLEETGIVVHYPPALELLAREGAAVDEERQLVRIPPHLVKRALESAPREVTVHGQSDVVRDCLLVLDGRRYGRTPTGLNCIVDHGTVQRRPVIAEDVVNWTRVIHELPHIHIAGSLCDQQEPTTSAEVRCLARMLPHTDKPLMFSAFSGEGMRWLGRIMEVVQDKARQPRFMVLSSVNSPLVYGWGQCEAAMVSAEVGIPVCFNSSAVSGVTAPVTLAGAVVQINAEMLAALTIIQLHRPGAAVVYAAHPMAMDMKSGMSSISTAEVGLMSAACVDLGRYYGLPTSANGLCTDTCAPDPMATLEKWTCGYLPAMAGANVNGGAGSLACVGSVSLEQLVIDDDLYGHLHRHGQGIEVDEESLAAGVIDAVGPGRAFLMEDHTLAHFRTEHYSSPLANRLNAPAWEAAGGVDVIDRAAERVRAILAQPAESFLTEEQTREIGDLVDSAEEALRSLEVRI